jgi:hypothetical protein
MLYVSFGSISGVIHLIAKLPIIGRMLAILLVGAVLTMPLR